MLPGRSLMMQKLRDSCFAIGRIVVVLTVVAPLLLLGLHALMARFDLLPG